MSPVLLVPLIASVAFGALATVIQRRLPPRRAVQALTATVVVCALAVVWALLLGVLGWIASIGWVANRLGWCTVLVSHPHGSLVIGVASLGGLGWCLAGGSLALARHRAAAAKLPASSGVQVLPLTEPIAYAVPGKPGHVVVSLGALQLLDKAERSAMLAHEQAHLDRHHHRFVRTGDVAAGAVPPLRPMARRLRFATERWADEEAASAVGDRTVVARAIIKVALARTSLEPVGSMAIAGVGVPERVDALLLEGPRLSGLAVEISVGFTALTLVAATAASTVQLHHVFALARHVCPF